jgi:hypothetical protein
MFRSLATLANTKSVVDQLEALMPSGVITIYTICD